MASKLKTVRNGRRIYGSLLRLDDGRLIYVARRRPGEIFRSGEASVSDAMHKNTACWAIDEETLYMVRGEGASLIGVRCRQTGDLWVTSIANYFDRNKAKVLNYESRGGALQRYLPLEHFAVRHGQARIRA